jgi:hypothetical protein
VAYAKPHDVVLVLLVSWKKQPACRCEAAGRAHNAVTREDDVVRKTEQQAIKLVRFEEEEEAKKR